MVELAGTPHEDPMQSKASILRGFVAALEREGMLQEVRARVSPEARAYIDSPPPASTWMPSWPTEQIAEAVTEMAGLARWRHIAYLATRDGVVPLLRAAIEGFMRLFGAKPSSVLSRMQQITQSSTKGIEYQYASTGESACEMIVTYPFRRDLPLSTYYAVAGAFEVVFELCGVRGTIEDPEPLMVPQRNAARIRMRW